MKYIENIAERVRKAEERAAVIYAKTDGLLYKRLKTFYIISLSVAILMSLLYIGGRASHIYEITALKLDVVSTSDINTAKSSMLTTGIVCVLWLVSLVFIKLKKEIISLILTIAPGIVSCATLIASSQNTSEFNTGINTDFWLRHFIPLFLAMFFIVWMIIIKYRASLRFKTAYNNMVNRIYEQYGGKELREAEWEEFLNNYDPRAEEEKRRRNKKKAGEYKNIITD